MKKFGFVLKVILLLALITSGYYFLYLKPHKSKILSYSIHYSNLVENRNAYINLAKLNVNDPSFDLAKANLVDIIKKTNAEGLKSPLTKEEELILTRQNEILEKVFATNSYEEGAGVLKSDESVKLIQEESLLLEKYYLESR